ncbi:MAG: sigma-70 family RNA polymerase sigma factor [Ruminococcus sp.]|nr:sigma-70 family RNA polymerase sigma factor [Ruminococcus sp.]MBQ7133115.1 sigma-70 family RNA polymerase sigma factor [Ruminococcus sp.]
MADVLYAGLSYEQVVKKYFQTVASVCVLHIDNNADAQDCFQNTFVKLFEKSPEFSDENHMKAWLIRVAINECNNLRRKNRRTISLSQVSETSVISFPNDDKDDVSWALVQLEPKFRDVLYLRYCEEYTSNEIAEILGKNPNTIRTLLKRGKEKLKSIYGGDGE